MLKRNVFLYTINKERYIAESNQKKINTRCPNSFKGNFSVGFFTIAQLKVSNQYYQKIYENDK